MGKGQSVKGNLSPLAFVDIGPECFIRGDVINYQGDNFYRSCGYIVTRDELLGTSSCLKRKNHPGDVHEDYYGHIKKGPHDGLVPQETGNG